MKIAKKSKKDKKDRKEGVKKKIMKNPMRKY